MNSTILWRLRPGADRRIRGGHPWVYSNELSASPKGVEPGAPVELHDAKGQFLARGYGNAASLIAFRVLSRDEKAAEPWSTQGVFEALEKARRLRVATGMDRFSHRLCFGESDRMPGLVIDRYLLAPQGPGAVESQAFVIQAHTAGAQRMIPAVIEALQKLAGAAWARTAIVSRNDVGVRKLEGLEEEEPKVLRAVAGVDLTQAVIRVKSVIPGASAKPVDFATDLVGGQKTGFFLDQFANIELTVIKLTPLVAALGTTLASGGRPLKILDLCCYVGQWGTQLAAAFARAGVKVEVTAVDASDKALQSAKRNIENQGARCETMRGDVLKDLAPLAERSFDIVISDPPALIKGRKDIGPGTHAYLQLHTQAFRLLKAGGAIVACSCSALLEEEEFARTLTKAASRNQVDVRWVGRGMQAPDHPVLTEFPEGRYLKCWIGVSSS
jgi:23S rRNA (cytosine1962-C5)-methyltransferase